MPPLRISFNHPASARAARGENSRHGFWKMVAWLSGGRLGRRSSSGAADLGSSGSYLITSATLRSLGLTSTIASAVT